MIESLDLKVRKYGLMRVINKYPCFFKALFQSKISIIFLPLKAFSALLYLAATSVYAFFNSRSKNGLLPSPKVKSKDIRLPRIISVGNIEVGGTGKTPVSVELARALRDKDADVVVVMRGYGRKGDRPVVVPSRTTGVVGKGEIDISIVPAEERSSKKTVELVGDEAVIYREVGIPVVIDGDRVRGVKLAIELFKPSHIILDDAFQHRRIHRDIDIVLVDHSRPLGNGFVLPLGTLREPPSALKRADIVIATRAKGREVPVEIKKIIEGKPFFVARHRVSSLVDAGGNELPVSAVHGRRVVLFSAIARPESFEADCIDAGLEIEASIRYMDHHRYSEKDAGEIFAEAGSEENIFITTEKDICKIADIFPAGERLFALRIKAEIGEMDTLVEMCLH